MAPPSIARRAEEAADRILARAHDGKRQRRPELESQAIVAVAGAALPARARGRCRRSATACAGSRRSGAAGSRSCSACPGRRRRETPRRRSRALGSVASRSSVISEHLAASASNANAVAPICAREVRDRANGMPTSRASSSAARVALSQRSPPPAARPRRRPRRALGDGRRRATANDNGVARAADRSSAPHAAPAATQRVDGPSHRPSTGSRAQKRSCAHDAANVARLPSRSRPACSRRRAARLPAPARAAAAHRRYRR